MQDLSYSERIDERGRLQRVVLAMTALFVVLALRLLYLQVIEGARYRIRSEKNQFRTRRLIAPRGLILDRNRKILVDNRPAFALCAVPAEMGDVDSTLAELAGLIEVDTAHLKRELDLHSANPYEQIVFEQDADFRQVTLVEENSVLVPGIITSVRPRRRYALSHVAGNLVGYLNEVNQNEIDASPELRPGDLMGRGGIEQAYDEQLRGENGGLLIETFAQGRPQLEVDLFGRPVARRDSLGRPLRTERDDSVPGENIVLTLDATIQQAVEDAIEGLIGSVVVMDARTGGLLALASSPTYDPSGFVSGNSKIIRETLSGKDRPMLHRAFQGTYPPASTFKIVVAAAALNSGSISPEWSTNCTGSYTIGNSWSIRCWKRYGHGRINLVEGLTYSCDVCFYTLGHQLGIDLIEQYARLFGMGAASGIDLPAEKGGLVPGRAWKRRYRASASDPSERRWYPGETLNVSIGQGQLLATPLQMARVAAVIVNGGYLVTPHVADYVMDAGGRVVATLRPDVPDEPIVNRQTVRTIREGLRLAVEKDKFPTGTGHLAKTPGLNVIGKTGTGQVVSGYKQSDDPLQLDLPYNTRDHAWFVGGVLDESFPIAFAVLVEHGGHGGDRAAPIARQLIEVVYGIGDRRPAMPVELHEFAASRTTDENKPTR